MLPDGFTIRPATMDDIQAVVDLMIASDLAQYDEPDVDPNRVRLDFEEPGHDLERNTWMVFAPDGRLAGFTDTHLYVEDFEVSVDGYTHPDFWGMGVGTAMLELAEARAHELAQQIPGNERVKMMTGIIYKDEGARSLLEGRGWIPVRHFYTMEIELDAPPPEPVWPEGITVRPFVLGQDDYATYEAQEEAFADHWNHAKPPYEEWERVKIKGGDLDPSLWFLAVEGDEIVGVALCKYRAGLAWVQNLGVRKPWRKRGIGEALLLHSFGEFYRRGERRIGLGVDAASPTGATRLYERVGMKPVRQYVAYEKEARAGVTQDA